MSYYTAMNPQVYNGVCTLFDRRAAAASGPDTRDLWLLAKAATSGGDVPIVSVLDGDGWCKVKEIGKLKNKLNQNIFFEFLV